jgi:hypothetical protein
VLLVLLVLLVLSKHAEHERVDPQRLGSCRGVSVSASTAHLSSRTTAAYGWVSFALSSGREGRVGPRVLGGAVELDQVWAQSGAVTGLPNDPEVFLVGDVREVPDQGRHQP